MDNPTNDREAIDVLPVDARPITVEAIDLEELEKEVSSALADDPALISNEVRSITLRALSTGELDREAIARVTRAVITGATRGVDGAQDRRQALKEAMEGLDEALAAAAQATQLTLQEAMNHVGAVSRQSLRARLDDLRVLESMFVDTLRQGAGNAAGIVGSTLEELAEHAQASGSAVGRRVRESVEELEHAVSEMVVDGLETTSEVLRRDASLLASLGSGVLKGISERLHPAVKEASEESQNP